jgi:hypothetical protein
MPSERFRRDQNGRALVWVGYEVFSVVENGDCHAWMYISGFDLQGIITGVLDGALGVFEALQEKALEKSME